MRTFLRNGENCNQLASEALRISALGIGQHNHGQLLRHKDILNRLGKLISCHSNKAISDKFQEGEHSEGVQLDKSIELLLESEKLSSNSQSILRPILVACRPLIQARIENLAISQDLIRSSEENLNTYIHLQSLQIT